MLPDCDSLSAWEVTDDMQAKHLRGQNGSSPLIGGQSGDLG